MVGTCVLLPGFGNSRLWKEICFWVLELTQNHAKNLGKGKDGKGMYNDVYNAVAMPHLKIPFV